jgi:dTDP-4-dehydrorhamnose 3,5-epimerase
MEVRPMKLPGTHEILLQPRRDERGYFMRVYDSDEFQTSEMAAEWVQESEAFCSQKGVVRGLHFQKPPFAEAKLVRVVFGCIWDVFLDLRRSSKSYGQWDAIELSGENPKVAFLPKGFAHGYCTLSEESLVAYKIDSRYVPEAALGIRWDDADLAIPWPVQNAMISARDSALPRFRDFVTPFD